MKLLVTGFEPFGGEKINASWEAVRALPCRIESWELSTLCLPVEFGRAADIAMKYAFAMKADAILCIGQAAGRNDVTPELVGINLRHARIADNAGFQPQDAPVCPEGNTAYFATMPVRKMAEAILAAGVNASVSYSAGTYVCNDLLYTLLHVYNGSSVSVGFIHVPPTPQQVSSGQPSLTTEACCTAIRAVIASI